MITDREHGTEEVSEHSPTMGGMARTAVRAAPVDVVGAVTPPDAFASPRTAPLEIPQPRVDIAAGQPLEAPRTYQVGDQRPLSDLVPRRRSTRQPLEPFAAISATGLGNRDRRDPHDPILTTRSTPRPSGWAAPTEAPVSTVRPPRFQRPTMPSALNPTMPEVRGRRTFLDLCRALGWPWLIVLLLGSLWSPLSIPALVAVWVLAVIHPFASRDLIKLLGSITALVLLIGLMDSPVRDTIPQLAWAAWIGCIVVLGASLLVIDRRLTPDEATPGSRSATARGRRR